MTIGAAGVGGFDNNQAGGNGGSTIFGTYLTILGGFGGNIGDKGGSGGLIVEW